MKNLLLLATMLAGGAAIALPGTVQAGAVPAGWSCTGNCGTDGADGNIPLSPLGNSSYFYVSTNGGSSGVGKNPITPSKSPTDGSLLTTLIFTANAGTTLSYYFDFITSDGGSFADNTWAALFNSDGTAVAEIYNTTTAQTGVLPGTTVSWLGTYSGKCYATGCGNTGWQSTSYQIVNAGSYYLGFGTTNSGDTAYDTGLAIDGITIDGVQLVPEPISLALLGFGTLVAGIASRRRV